MALTDNEYSTPKITPADGVQIPSVGSSSGYQLDEELREYIQEGVTGVTEEYSTLMTYAYGKRLKHEGVEYRCIVPVESPEIFDPDKWVKVDLTELDKRVLENASAINAISAYDDSDYVDLMSSITILSSYISIDKFKMKRKGDIVFVCLYGTWSGTPSASTNNILSGIPSKYLPTKSADIERTFCGLAYGNPPVQTARVRIDSTGTLQFPENNFISGAFIRIYGCYCL